MSYSVSTNKPTRAEAKQDIEQKVREQLDPRSGHTDIEAIVQGALNAIDVLPDLEDHDVKVHAYGSVRGDWGPTIVLKHLEHHVTVDLVPRSIETAEPTAG